MLQVCNLELLINCRQPEPSKWSSYEEARGEDLSQSHLACLLWAENLAQLQVLPTTKCSGADRFLHPHHPARAGAQHCALYASAGHALVMCVDGCQCMLYRSWWCCQWPAWPRVPPPQAYMSSMHSAFEALVLDHCHPAVLHPGCTLLQVILVFLTGSDPTRLQHIGIALGWLGPVKGSSPLLCRTCLRDMSKTCTTLPYAKCRQPLFKYWHRPSDATSSRQWASTHDDHLCQGAWHCQAIIGLQHAACRAARWTWLAATNV